MEIRNVSGQGAIELVTAEGQRATMFVPKNDGSFHICVKYPKAHRINFWDSSRLLPLESFSNSWVRTGTDFFCGWKRPPATRKSKLTQRTSRRLRSLTIKASSISSECCLGSKILDVVLKAIDHILSFVQCKLALVYSNSVGVFTKIVKDHM